MFILNQTSDKITKTTGQIVLKAFLWLIGLMAVGVMLRAICIAIYLANGINPMEIAKFGGDPTTHMGNATWKTILKLLLVAPICEEIIFRLGLAFNRKTDALWIGILPFVVALYLLKCKIWYIILALLVVGVVIFYLVYRFTTDRQWAEWREKYLKYSIWITAIAFGLLHLTAFSTISLQLLPFILTTILMPFLGGCAVTYARVNLNFFWGILFHMAINIPGSLMIFISMMFTIPV